MVPDVRGSSAASTLPAGPPTSAGFRPVDPTAVLDASTPVRAVGAFLLVLLVGAVVLRLFEARVGRSIDASIDRPVASTVYGLVAHAAVAVAAAYAYSLLVGVAPTVAGVGLTVAGIAWLVAASFGFVVVGGWFTGIAGVRRPWTGLVFGAGVAGAAWLLPSPAGAAVWLVAVSLGIGGRTREWVHASRSVAPDAERP